MSTYGSDYTMARMEAPQLLTIDRLEDTEELILAQSTSEFCRCCCFQQSINWVIAEQNNYEPGTNPFDLPESGWIHEESSLCGRWWSWILPGCRKVKYVQHAGQVPEVLKFENDTCFHVQSEVYTTGLTEQERADNVVATHEKHFTCGYCFNLGDYSFPICNCFPLPYLDTKRADGTNVGKTLYICDACCFVPKFDVFDAAGNKKFRIRPDTFCLGACVRCRCGGGGGNGKGKCFRIPFLVRDPHTLESLPSSSASSSTADSNNAHEKKAMIDSLWTGWANECCRQKNAYHVVYPADLTVDEKLLLTGSSLLIDLTMFEQQEDN